MGDRVVKKVLDPPTRPSSFWDRDGFFACQKCKECREVAVPLRGLDTFTLAMNNKEFVIKEFITCNITHVVYILECPCGVVGRTKRPLRVRIAEHIQNIKLGFKDHNVSLHFKLHHNQDPSGLKFWVVDHVKPVWRGSKMVRELPKRETYFFN